ncbi:MAG: protein-L-isoaspartate(D-aspartate) O-methyltransferase [Dehalococcoidia bacterium]
MAIDFAGARLAMVEGLRSEVSDEHVLRAIARVPREEFVPPEFRHLAYEDRPIPIGLGQTISQPLMVATMTELLRLQGIEKVLEVGTGSGYQAAILAELASWVVTVERLPDLAELAAERLRRLGYTNVTVHVASGALGWPEEAPYHGILVTAGAPRIPRPLVEQLAVGGRLVIPVGRRQIQQLLSVTREPETVRVRRHGPCRFVPLIGEEAWPEEESVSG